MLSSSQLHLTSQTSCCGQILLVPAAPQGKMCLAGAGGAVIPSHGTGTMSHVPFRGLVRVSHCLRPQASPGWGSSPRKAAERVALRAHPCGQCDTMVGGHVQVLSPAPPYHHGGSPASPAPHPHLTSGSLAECDRDHVHSSNTFS